MATLSKIIVSSLLGLLFLSCSFNGNSIFGVSGNGEVKTEQRTISESFHSIEASHGLDVYISQSNEESIAVQADENLHELIITEVNDGILKITTSKNIGSASAKKVMLGAVNIKKIKGTSGSDIFSNNTLTAENLEISANSGSDIHLSIEAETVNANASSGSDIKLEGTTNSLTAQASSGADIKAKELIVGQVNAKASSGSDIIVTVTNELEAAASSGGSVKYYGNPTIISKSDDAVKKGD